MFKDKNLLVLSHTYNSFIKDPIEVLAKDFNKIYVLVRHQPLSELGNIIPLPFFRNRAKYSKKYSIDLTNKPENVEVFAVPFFYLPFGNLYLKAGRRHARKAMEIIERNSIKFDIIHAHFTWSSGYAGVQIKEKYKKPLVITGHGYDIYKLPKRSQRFKEAIQNVLNSADQVLTVSKKNKQYLEQMKVKKVKVLPNGYTPSLFYYKDKQKCRKKLQLPINKKIILTIGNLEEVKGYEYLIKALEIVCQKDPNFLCIHIGAGSLERYLRNIVKETGLESHIQFLGRQPHIELVDYFGAADFFVSSSLAEGNPTVMFESLGCGKPFIGTKVGGVPEVIFSEEYGLLCEPKDQEALAQNILKAFNIDWDTNEILAYGEKYSWENICGNILDVYKENIR